MFGLNTNRPAQRRALRASPATRIPEPGVEQSRDRVLNDDELRELWQRLEALAEDTEPDEGDVGAADDATGDEREETQQVTSRITSATAQAFQAGGRSRRRSRRTASRIAFRSSLML